MKLSLKFSAASSILILAAAFAGCTKKNNNGEARLGIDPAKIAQASPQIENSFRAKSTNDGSPASEASGLAVDKSHLMIQKSALGKEFLLSVNMLAQTPTPSFSSLQSRVVSFILRDDKVYLLDVTKNNVVGVDNIPQSLLIAAFNILSQSDTSIELDFNNGMAQIFESADMYTPEDPAAAPEAAYKLTPAAVNISYLDEVSLSNGAVFIKQVAQLNRGDSAEPVEVRYQIKPYLPDPSFKPVVSPGLSKVGYFEANPITLPDGSTRVYAMKWNESKTIQFAISANTPEKYRGLVRSALLYWNKILGDKALEVVQLEDKNKTAPSFDTNIIQWVDYDAAGAAFADAHVDPRSGEVTSAQIFMPSAFMDGNVEKRVRLTEESHAPQHKIGLKGFKNARLCERDMAKDFASREAGIAIPQDAMDKAVNDYVYEVIAHELGHVLGLRHNFAASLAANYDFKDRKDLILSYYKNKKAPAGIIPSSSVMEYSRFEESAWNGDNFQNGDADTGKALAYDDMAMRYLYQQKPLPEKDRPLFCTDDDKNTYVDCSTNDAGRSIVSTAAGLYQANMNSLAARVLNLFITGSKRGDASGANLIPVAQVNLNAASIAKSLGSEFAKAVSLMKEGSRFISVESQYKPILATNKADVVKASKEYLQAEFTRLGGLEEVLKTTPDTLDADLNARFAALLEDPLYNSGVGRDGQAYSFSEEEKQTMKAQVAIFAPLVKEALMMNELKALSGANFDFSAVYGQDAADADVPWMDSDLTYQLSPLLLKRFERFALAKTDQKLSSEVKLKDGTTQQISLPVYQYSQPLRMAAANLFSNPHKAVDWAYIEKSKAADEFDAEMEALGDEPEKIQKDQLDRNILQWILNNNKVAGALGGD
jgi:hypothetical protein